MSKTIIITGSTDGIGKVTARELAAKGHQVIVHGRNETKVNDVIKTIKAEFPEAKLDGFVADLSIMSEVKALIKEIKSKYNQIDILINNAGIFKAREGKTLDGLELRLMVNTIAPYLLTKELLEILAPDGRVVNLSSAAQAPVNIEAIKAYMRLSDSDAYAQSKLGITMWSIELAKQLTEAGSKQVVVAINPKSFLGSKMVKEAYGTDGYNLNIGADILQRAALSDEFASASGRYFDNDQGRFANPHPDALKQGRRIAVIEAIESVLAGI